ncbi:hypothetical protein [Cryptosporangium minutisporangium]|uniref:Uncharacterized protein n=1 Tax=Cryptosporangium minutisporangium TaxID=113569 RepID=A0ABP6SU76_9ACTN
MSVDRARIQAVLPDYAVGEEIADGAVYRARERRLGEDRVVTVLASFGPGLAAPEHPHIVRIPNNGYLFRPSVTLPTDATPTAAAFNPDATRVAVAAADGTVQLRTLRR